MTTDPLWQQVMGHWRQSGLTIRPGVSDVDVAVFQQKYGVVLPAEMQAFLRAADGTGRDDMDNALMSFWSLAEIAPVHEVLNDHRGVDYPDRWAYPDCFVFADHLMDSWLYAVELTADPQHLAPVYLVRSPEGGRMSSSFIEFMACYAKDPKSVW